MFPSGSTTVAVRTVSTTRVYADRVTTPGSSRLETKMAALVVSVPTDTVTEYAILVS